MVLRNVDKMQAQAEAAAARARRTERRRWTEARVQERELNKRWLVLNADKLGDPEFTRLLRLMRSAEDRGHINFVFMESMGVRG